MDALFESLEKVTIAVDTCRSYLKILVSLSLFVIVYYYYVYYYYCYYLKNYYNSLIIYNTLMYIIILQYEGRKKENVSFNDKFNTFYLQLYGIRHMVMDDSDSERGNLLPPLHGILPVADMLPHHEQMLYH